MVAPRGMQKLSAAAHLRRKKRGFAVNVVDEWFHSSLNSKLPEVLLDETSLMFSLLNPVAVRKLLEAHRSRRQDNHKLIFSLVMFEQWLRTIRSRKFQQSELIPAVREAPCLAGAARDGCSTD